MPKKRPAYRESREHSDFLCKLNEYIPSKDIFLEELLVELNTIFDVKLIEKKEFESIVTEATGEELITQVARTSNEYL